MNLGVLARGKRRFERLANLNSRISAKEKKARKSKSEITHRKFGFFFVFVFFPNVILVGWPWISWLS